MKAFVLLAFVFLTGKVSASDHYSWLRDDSRGASKVLDYLAEQNDKTQQYQDSIQSISESLGKNGKKIVQIELKNHGRKSMVMNMRS